MCCVCVCVCPIVLSRADMTLLTLWRVLGLNGFGCEQGSLLGLVAVVGLAWCLAFVVRGGGGVTGNCDTNRFGCQSVSATHHHKAKTQTRIHHGSSTLHRRHGLVACGCHCCYSSSRCRRRRRCLSRHGAGNVLKGLLQIFLVNETKNGHGTSLFPRKLSELTKQGIALLNGPSQRRNGLTRERERERK